MTVSRTLPFFPAILLALALLAVLAPLPAPAAQTGDLDALRRHALDLVNTARREHGLEPLTFSDPLNAAAQGHAEDMLRRDFYSHVTPDGTTPQDRYLAQGGGEWALSAENIASCSPCAARPDTARVDALHRGWMDSPEHRENILRPGLTRFGYGIVAGEDGPLYAVQTFAGPGTSRTGSDGATLADGDAAQAFARALNRRRQDDALPPLDLDPVLSDLAARLLPTSPGGEIRLDPPGGLMAALPPAAQGDWRALRVLAGSCGGCGAQAAQGDIGYFLDFWMEDSGSAETLLSRDTTALGFALRAYGGGRKVAVAVLGRGR